MAVLSVVTTVVTGQVSAVASASAPRTAPALSEAADCVGFKVVLTQRGLHRDGRVLYAWQGQENIDFTVRVAGQRYDTIAWTITQDGQVVELAPPSPDNNTFNFEADELGTFTATATVTCGSLVQEASLQFEVRAQPLA